MFAFNNNVHLIFWIAIVPAFLSVLVLIFGVNEPEQALRSAGPNFRMADVVKLNRATWIVIAATSILTFVRFSEAFLLLKSLEIGFQPAWIPVTMVVMHAVCGLTAYPAGRLSDALGRTGLLAASVGVLVAAYVVSLHMRIR
jgi:hypothetical protein